jgi:uncharacterized repeat protein (TIGR01451 family)
MRNKKETNMKTKMNWRRALPVAFIAIFLAGLLWPAASATAANTPKTYYLRNSGPTAFNLTLSETAGTATTETYTAALRTYKDTTISSLITNYAVVGTWALAGLLPDQAVTDLGSASLWLGLSTSDSVGLKADVQVEVLKNGEVISTAYSLCISLARVPSSAVSIDLPAPSSPVHFDVGDTLSLRLSARRATGCAGHAAGILRFHYNRSNRASNFGATINPDADLSITKTDSPDPVTPGQNLTYTITVTNNGPNNATGVTVSDPLPANVTWVSTTTPIPSTISAGESKTETIVVTVNPSASGTISNTASVTATQPDPTTPNTATATTTVTPSGADLSVTKADSPDPVLQGQELTYTVTVTNSGPAQATGVTLTDTLPAGVTFVSATPTGTESGGIVTCDLGSIDSGSNSVVTIKVKPGADAAEAETITNTATVSSLSTDPDSTNNTATADTAVTKDTDEDGIPDDVDCNKTIADDIVVDPDGDVPESFTGLKVDTLQQAVVAALDNDVISMYANTVENVVIGDSTGSGGKDLLIIGCGSRVTAASAALPVIHVEASAGANDGDTGQGERDIEFVDVDVRNGSGGYLIETSKVAGVGTDTYLKGIRAESSSGIGIKVAGSGNEVRGSNGVKFNAGLGIQVTGNGNLITENGVQENVGIGIDVTGNNTLIKKNKVGEEGKGNGAGIHVVGDSNDLLENDVFDNSGDGIIVFGAGNLIKQNDIGDRDKGNAGDGIHVFGAGNTLQENNVFASGGDGIDVGGGTFASPNVIYKNDVGDRNKGNQGNGILVDGLGNGTVAPAVIEIDENNVFANALAGIKVTGSGHQLRKNASSDNGGCEYDLASGNFDAGDNEANDDLVALTIPGCTGTSTL